MKPGYVSIAVYKKGGTKVGKTVKLTPEKGSAVYTISTGNGTASAGTYYIKVVNLITTKKDRTFYRPVFLFFNKYLKHTP
jgi:hypothetical protein